VTKLLMWQNLNSGPIFCGSVIFKLDDGRVKLEAYGQRLMDYLLKSESFLDFELSEPYGFPVFGFRHLVIDISQRPIKEDEPFIFNMYPKL